MINSGTVDIHIEPYTHTNKYSSEPIVVVCYSCCFAMLQKLEVIFISILVNQQLVHYASFLVISFDLFSRSHVLASP